MKVLRYTCLGTFIEGVQTPSCQGGNLNIFFLHFSYTLIFPYGVGRMDESVLCPIPSFVLVMDGVQLRKD